MPERVAARVRGLPAAGSRDRKKGWKEMENRKPGNLLPRIHRFVTNELGENYWFHGCCRYVMGALGRPELDYECFAGLTGDIFTQVYAFDRFRGDCASDYLLSAGRREFVEDVFAWCGYEAEFVPDDQVKAQKGACLQRIIESIDRGVPVISNLLISGNSRWLVFVGYEDYGETLLFMTDNMTQPERVPAAEAFAPWQGDGWARGLIFLGGQREQKDPALLYRQAIERLPGLLTMRTPEFCFGPAAFRAWADYIERGGYSAVLPEDFERDKWYIYTNYICILATNGSCCHEFLERARRLNPDMAWLSELDRLYGEMANMWEKDPDGLEAMGAGFNITLEALKDRESRGRIAAKLRDFAGCAGRVLEVLERELPADGGNTEDSLCDLAAP